MSEQRKINCNKCGEQLGWYLSEISGCQAPEEKHYTRLDGSILKDGDGFHEKCVTCGYVAKGFYDMKREFPENCLY